MLMKLYRQPRRHSAYARLQGSSAPSPTSSTTLATSVHCTQHYISSSAGDTNKQLYAGTRRSFQFSWRGGRTCAASLMRWLMSSALVSSMGTGQPRTTAGCGGTADDSSAPGHACTDWRWEPLRKAGGGDITYCLHFLQEMYFSLLANISIATHTPCEPPA